MTEILNRYNQKTMALLPAEHILYSKKGRTSTVSNQNTIFKNRTQLRMGVTRYILQEQMKSTLICMKGCQTITDAIAAIDNVIKS
ncbi:hypothetical protein [Oceanobacillus senegalensis]|uniref:hypothetical protein n=1 Tax=Oceanobacillus senegalensis TaxID=1936063 RepID=UPI000A30F658|nr:hypothetical protein [Oceanobacillus senegalensis]